MEKQEISQLLEDFVDNAIVSVKWDRGNGIIEKTCVVYRESEVERSNTALYLYDINTGKKGENLDLEKIGYNNILNLEYHSDPINED